MWGLWVSYFKIVINLNVASKKMRQVCLFITTNRMNDIEKLELVTDYFKVFFSDEILEHIVDHKNLNCVQQNITKGNIATDKDEIERYLGILFKMSIIQAPYY